MPVSDFSTRMAQMIAQARPQQAPPSRGHTVLHGGGEMGSLGGKATQTNVGVDLGAIIGGVQKLMGTDPEAKKRLYEEADLYHKIHEKLRLEGRSEEADKMLSDLQSRMEMWAKKAQYPGIIASGPADAYGRKSWRFTPMPVSSEDLKAALQRQMFVGQGGKPTQAGERYAMGVPFTEAPIKAGMWDIPPLAQDVVKSRVEAAAPETTPAPTPPALTPSAKYVESESKIAAAPPHESVLRLREAQLKNEGLAQQIKQKELELAPEEFKMKQAEHEEKMALMAKDAKRIDAEISKIDLEKLLAMEGVTKEERRAALKIDDAFDDFRRSWMTKHVYTKDDETSNFQKINELVPEVSAHISGMKSYSNDPRAAERSVRTLFSQIEREFARPTITPSWLRKGAAAIPLVGPQAEPQAAVNQQAYRRRYVQMAADILQQAGSRSSDLYETLNYWALKAGYNANDRNKLLLSFGFTPEQVTGIVNRSALRFRP